MAKMNKTLTYAVLWLNNQGLDNSKIANELSITEKQVKAVVDKAPITEPQSNSIPTTSSPVGKIKPKDLMITESASRTRNVSIMTQQASALNDEFKKRVVPKSDNQNGIFRPFKK
jgi:orotate phosphoribosyltransferase-like protein